MITLLGVTIDSNDLSFSDEDNPINQAEFFTALKATQGIAVKAKGEESIGWTELELER